LARSGTAVRGQAGQQQILGAGRGYYRDVCFKVNALAGGELAEFGDGGFTGWGMRLAASGRERLLISGLGVDRVARFL